MEKLIDGLLGLIEVVLITGAVGVSTFKIIEYAHDEMKKQTVEVLLRPSPSLQKFTTELTKSKERL